MLVDIDIACGVLNCCKPNLGSFQLTCELLTVIDVIDVIVIAYGLIFG